MRSIDHIATQIIKHLVDVQQVDDEDLVKHHAYIVGKLGEVMDADPVPHVNQVLLLAHTTLGDPEKGHAVKDRSGREMYRYANLQTALPSIRAFLAENECTVRWTTRINAGVLFMVCEIASTQDGSVLESMVPYNYTGTNPQDVGSWLTYTQRYALFQALGLAAGADDDGKAGKDAAPRSPNQRTSPATTQGKPQTRPEILRAKLNLELGETDEELVALMNDFLTEVKGTDTDIEEATSDQFWRTINWLGGKGASLWADFYAKATTADPEGTNE